MAHDVGRASPALGVVLSAGSAGLALLAFPPASIGPLILVAFVPMLVAQHVLFTRRWAGLAPALAIAGFYGVYAWDVFPGDAPGRIRGAVLAFAAVLVVVGGLERLLQRVTDYRCFTFVAPLAWVAVDFLRGGVPQLSTWGYPAYALFAWPTVLQPVSLTGVLGLNLLILLVNWSIAGLVIAVVRPGLIVRPRAVIHASAVGVVVIVWVLAGVAMMEDPRTTVRVAAVQPGVSGDFGPGPGVEGGMIPGRYVAATTEAASKGARLVVWPEYGLFFDPRRLETDEFRDLAEATDAYVAIGYGDVGPQGNRNEAVVLTPDGRFLGPYGKQHPVTVLGEKSTTRYGYPVYETAIGRLATIICYDLDFTDTARAVSRRGAQIVAVPSQDWDSIAAKHYPLLVFRAIENRLSMVKADVGYDSAVIDPYGRILEKVVSPEGASALLIADVPLGAGDTLAGRLGDWVGWALVLVAVGVIGMLAVWGRRQVEESPENR